MKNPSSYARGLAVALTLLVGDGRAGAADASATPARPAAPIFENLGGHHHPITTTSPEAQRYFDQGLMLLLNFNHKEAIRSFRAAAALDPQCAMAWWGEAFAHGPHSNSPMADKAVGPAWAALQEAPRRVGEPARACLHRRARPALCRARRAARARAARRGVCRGDARRGRGVS